MELRFFVKFVLLYLLREVSSSFRPRLVEGDIVYDERLEMLTKIWQGRSRRDTLADRMFLWQDGVVPYVISKNMSIRGRKVIRRAFREITRRTCVSFLPKQTYHLDYIFLVSGKSCFSSIGRVGGRQVISLHDNCKYRGKAVHEILHALGFFHEHSRSDRDRYIKVIWRNIKKGMRKNFRSYKHGPLDALGEPYDYTSIMHYDNKAFSRNGEDTIRSLKNPEMRLGQIRRMSKTDIKQLVKLYHCKKSTLRRRRRCIDKQSTCKSTTTRSDICETNYKLMRELCPLSCGFCG